MFSVNHCIKLGPLKIGALGCSLVSLVLNSALVASAQQTTTLQHFNILTDENTRRLT